MRGLQLPPGEQLSKLLIRLGYLRKDSGVPFSTLEDEIPDAGALAAVREGLARAAGAAVLGMADGELTIALADPFATIGTIERSTGFRIRVVGAPGPQIAQAIDRFYRAPPGETAPNGRPEREPREELYTVEGGREIEVTGIEAQGTTTRIVEEIFQRGIGLGATDIHIEPTENAVQVR